MTLMSVIVAFLFAISLWYLSSNHKVTFVKLKATDLKFLPNRSWHRLIPAGGTFVSAKGGTFQSDTPGTFVSAMRGTIDSAVPGTFESDTGGTFNPLLSDDFIASYNSEPDSIIIDADDTNADTYGAQQLTLLNAYYGEYCYMPLLLFEGRSGKLILPILRPGRGNKAINISGLLKRLITKLRKK